MKCFLIKLMSDEKGNYSHARLIALLVGFSATFFMWKLMVMGEMTIEYLIAYLSYGVIHQSLNKSLDTLKSIFGRQP